MKIEYRKLTSKKAEEAREFCLKIIKEVYGYDYKTEWHSDLDNLLVKDGIYTQKQKGIFYLALLDNKIVGTIGIRSLETKPELLEKFKKRYSKIPASIWRAYVSEELRNKGIGKKLVSLGELEAKKIKYNKIYLHTSQNNPAAVIFWIRRGYKTFLEENNQDLTVHMDKNL